MFMSLPYQNSVGIQLSYGGAPRAMQSAVGETWCIKKARYILTPPFPLKPIAIEKPDGIQPFIGIGQGGVGDVIEADRQPVVAL